MPTPGSRAGLRAPGGGRLLRLASLAALLAVAGGCASATKRLEQGQELEQRGRPADAAARYVDALKKDPALADARAGLQRTGDEAVRQSLDASAAHEAAGRLDAAADELLELDGLRDRAQQVGVQLTVPADYARHRAALFDRAIHAAMGDARDALERGQWSAALGRLDRAGSRWQPTSAQQTEMARIRFDVESGWAGAELQGGRYRSAYDHAARAVALYGEDDPRAAAAFDLRATALERGTLTVAVLPIAVSREADSLPTRLLDDVEGDLARLHWTKDELFVRMVDEARVVRAARNLLRTRDVPSRAEASRLARQLDADLLVSVRVDDVVRTREEGAVTRRAVKTRTGQDTAYTVRSGREVLELHVSFELLTPDGYAPADRGSFTLRADEDYRRGQFAGDWRQLDIPRGDRELFTAGPTRTDERLAAEIAERMAPRLADAVFSSLRNQVR